MHAMNACVKLMFAWLFRRFPDVQLEVKFQTEAKNSTPLALCAVWCNVPTFTHTHTHPRAQTAWRSNRKGEQLRRVFRSVALQALARHRACTLLQRAWRTKVGRGVGQGMSGGWTGHVTL